jgi:Flp pilus assembly protein protease CpaA
MVTIAAESFGTNLRSTVTTTVPNFVRGALVVITILYKAFQSMGIAKMEAVLITGVIVAGISLIMAYRTEETYGKDLEYIEV